mmetsp:Transcript_7446/g.22632  ORF Transcript_7446/g.22632 Transcript_7446/m.22632 type:complete len:108 (+) Transcript_7446:295-618(+)
MVRRLCRQDPMCTGHTSADEGTTGVWALQVYVLSECSAVQPTRTSQHLQEEQCLVAERKIVVETIYVRRSRSRSGLTISGTSRSSKQCQGAVGPVSGGKQELTPSPS